MDNKTSYRMLWPERTPSKIGIQKYPHMWKVPEQRWSNLTYPVHLWGSNQFKDLSPGTSFYEAKWLLEHFIK
jgi:hypothetical protein